MITADVFKKALPEKAAKAVNQSVIDKINLVCQDPLEAQYFTENLMSYTSVLMDGKYKIDDYLNAVRYVTAKLTGSTNEEAYSKVFPDRYNTLLAAGKTPKQISSYVAAYNGNKLVNAILEQSLIPIHITNQHLLQKAINVQASLMVNARSEKVQCEAANSLMNHLKRPEAAKVDIDVNVNNGSMIQELRELTLGLAEKQQNLIASGAMNAKEIAHQEIIINPESESE